MLRRDERGAAVLGGVRLGDLFRTGSARTPAYVYDLGAMADAARALVAGFAGRPHLVAYAVKANSAGPVVRTLLAAGCGAEVVSGAELELVLRCGAAPDRILYAGVAKTAPELDRAIGAGDRGIAAIQVESVEEIARASARARALGRTARVSLRINPGVVADTHAHVATGHDEAKFGIARADLPAAFEALARAPGLSLVGVASHVGSQLPGTGDYLAAGDVLLSVAADAEARGHRLAFLDFGGGFGIDYGAPDGAEKYLPPADFARAIVARLAPTPFADRVAVVEPGRCLVGPFGVLCATVVGAKRSPAGTGHSSAGAQRRWLLVDAGMNDLVRPAMYGARHRIEPVASAPPGPSGAVWRVAGPVCESSDDFGEHLLGEPPPEQVLIRDAGAYGFVMASQYNGRALPAEIFVESGRVVATTAPRSESAWVDERMLLGPPDGSRGA